MAKKKKQGQIIYPKWTMSNKYQASCEPYRTGDVASFNTYSGAFNFLKRKGVTDAWYKASSNVVRDIDMKRGSLKKGRDPNVGKNPRVR